MEGIVYRVSRWLTYVGYVAIMVMMFLVVADVISRFLFNHPLLGLSEIIVFLLCILVFSGLAWTEAEDSNVIIPILYDRLPPGIQTPVYVFINLLGIGILGLITWRSIVYAGEQRVGGDLSATLSIPSFPFIYFVAFGSGLFALVLVAKIFQHLRERNK